MKTEKIIVSDLFERPRRYLIPLFQRGYVWTQEDQWQPLWDDILEQVEVLGRAKSAGTQSPRKHFLGAIVLQQQTLGVRHVPVSDVIDGQQRLTTLQLLLLALRDAVAPLSSEFLNSTLQRLTANPPPHLSKEEAHKVWPTSAFQDDFRAVAEAGSRNAVIKAFPLRKERRKSIPRPTLVEAYLFFYDRIVDYITPPKVEDAPASTEVTPDPSHAEELLEAIIRYVQLVEINLDAEDDPQIIFETLNARGAPLAPSDLVRNYVFLHATRRSEDVVQLYNSYWRQFDEAPDTARRSRTKRFWREPERQGRLLVNRLDLLLFHFLSSQLGSEFKLSHIFPAFRDWWDRSGAPPRSDTDLQVLKAASDIFSQLLLAEGDGPLAPFARALKTLDVSTVFPLVLYICERQPTIPDADFRGILADLESYLIRRAICALTPKNYNRVFLALVKQLRGESQLSRDLFQSALLSLEGDSSRWPDDASFLEAFVTKPAYTQLGPARTAYILESIEQQISTSKQENIQVLSVLTVEHVWPQNPRSGAWPTAPMTPDGKPDYATWIHRRTLIEGFGNLTLLTQPLNSSVSNGPYSDKQPVLIKESRLRLNTYFQDVPPEVSWDEVQIAKRAAVLAQSALARWPYPVAKK